MFDFPELRDNKRIGEILRSEWSNGLGQIENRNTLGSILKQHGVSLRERDTDRTRCASQE